MKDSSLRVIAVVMKRRNIAGNVTNGTDMIKVNCKGSILKS
jgi:hypothetical protein